MNKNRWQDTVWEDEVVERLTRKGYTVIPPRQGYSIMSSDISSYVWFSVAKVDKIKRLLHSKKGGEYILRRLPEIVNSGVKR